MYNAELKFDLGKDSKSIYEVLDKEIKFKRSSVKFKKLGDQIVVKVEANDQVALLASVSSVLKQLRIVSNAQSLFKD